jgi:ATP-binding cassette, subfamily F, member 2
MVSEASKKKAAQKKAAAAAKRGGKAATAAASSSSSAAAGKAANGIAALKLSDRTCTGVLASHPLSRDIHVSIRAFLNLIFL